MKEFNALPIYRVGFSEIYDGIEIKATDFCKKSCFSNKKCQGFYENLLTRVDGEYVCPYGFGVAIFSDEQKERYIFTGLRLDEVYNSKLVEPKIKYSKRSVHDFRKISRIDLKKYQKLFLEYKNGVESYEKLKNTIDDIFHDIRKYNSHLKQNSTSLYNSIGSKNKSSKYRDKILKIQSSCSFLSLRINTYDFIYNESLMDNSIKTSYQVYKIFDKARHCLEEKAKDNCNRIILDADGQCGYIQAYDSIEVLPYILLDNAIKYSNKGTEIKVVITDNAMCCQIHVESEGVCLKPEEMDKIFIRGYRGIEAKERNADGMGIGLYTAKKICELHNTDIQIHQKELQKYSKNSQKYCKFCVDIVFEK